MKIIANEKLIKRNGRIGTITSLVSIVVLGIGMFLSFRDKDGSLLIFTFGSLILGFLLFQVGNYYMARWGKSPRPDEKLTAALKGLDDKYSLYHYSTPISHLLVGPAGVLSLLPYQQLGTISYDETKNKWKQKGGSFFMKTFGNEGLGHPERDVKFALEDVTKYFNKLGDDADLGRFSPEVIMVFTNDKVILEADGATVPAMTADKLKDYIRKKAKTTAMPEEIYRKLEEKLVI